MKYYTFELVIITNVLEISRDITINYINLKVFLIPVNQVILPLRYINICSYLS
jgi:hypothetical protein